MKLLLLAASVIAVFTADSRDFTDKPDGGDSADDDPGSPGRHSSADLDQLFPDGTVDDTTDDESQTFHEEHDVHSSTESSHDFPKENVLQYSEFEESQLPDSSEEDHQLMKEKKSRVERGLRDSQCEANVICGILGGSCITNNTVCSGWLVSEGCKGSNCKCCIPGSLEIKMKNFGLELQSLKDDLTNSSLQQTLALQNMIANITNTNAGLKVQIQSFTDSKSNTTFNFESQLNNLTKVNAELTSKLDSIEADISKQGCPASPEGLFYFAASDQCFKRLNKTKYNWNDAIKACQAQGLELAKPYDPAPLNRYLVARYGNTAGYTWLGARGTGSAFRWQRDGKTIWSSSMLWYGGASGSAATSNCLGMLSETSHMKSKPDNPYNAWSCTSLLWALCELVQE